jgi:hypothetical protein
MSAAATIRTVSQLREACVSMRLTERFPEAMAALEWLEDRKPLPLALITFQNAIRDAVGMALTADALDSMREARAARAGAEVPAEPKR